MIGLREGGDGQEADCNAEDLSMMLRLQGPEALAKVKAKSVRLHSQIVLMLSLTRQYITQTCAEHELEVDKTCVSLPRRNVIDRECTLFSSGRIKHSRPHAWVAPLFPPRCALRCIQSFDPI